MEENGETRHVNQTFSEACHRNSPLPIVLLRLDSFEAPGFKIDGINCDDRVVPISAISQNIFVGRGKKDKHTRKQLPLVLAKCITIHKCQGASYDSIAIDTHNLKPRMMYVSLSRGRHYNRIYVLGKQN